MIGCLREYLDIVQKRVFLTGPRGSRDLPGRGGRSSLMFDADGVLTDMPGEIPASSFSRVSETDRLRN